MSFGPPSPNLDSAVLLLGTGLLLGCFQLLDFTGQIFVGGLQFAQLNKRTDDEDAHARGAVAFQHGSEHGYAVFGEGVGLIADVFLGCDHSL